MWLLTVAALIFAMVLVGGATRLTESGLSIVEWKPITGTVPPLSDAAWQAEFEKYKTIPQYQQRNRGMTLAEFKLIYWWEWTHRLLGRLIGVVFLLPFLWFLWKGLIEPGWRALALGDLWSRRAAGRGRLVDGGVRASRERVNVSQYRLAFHLTLACVIFALRGVDGAAARARYAPRERSRRAATAARDRARAVGRWCCARSISARWSPACARGFSTTPGR